MLKFTKCKFTVDRWGIYITPIVGVDWIQKKLRFWVGWLMWLWEIEWERKK